MKIKKITTQHLRIPLRIQFSQSNNSTNHSDSTIIKIETTCGLVGYGECCPRPYVTGETYESVKKDICKITSFLQTIEITSIETIRKFGTEYLPQLVGPSTICGTELALLDVWSKVNNCSIVELLAPGAAKTIQYSGVVPLKNFSKAVSLLSRFAFKDIKLKVDTNCSTTLAKIKTLRTVFGNDVNIRFDANCSWTYEQAQKLIPVFLQHDIHSFEQILPKGAENQMKQITSIFGDRCKVMADESVTTFASALQLIRKQQCNAFNLKISKNGGIFNTFKIYKLARQSGIYCQLGAHFGETSILCYAGHVFSALCPELKVHEGGFGDMLLERDVWEESLKMGRDGRNKITHFKNQFQETPTKKTFNKPKLVEGFSI